MARVPLAPFGSTRDAFLDAATFEKNRAALAAKEQELAARRAKVAAGWGPTYVERVHQKGKLCVRERIALLQDPGTEIREVGTFVNHGRRFGKPSPPPRASSPPSCRSRAAGRW